MEYYHNLITQKSLELLKELKRHYDYILIGGWAVFLLTKSLKSKDIDIILDYPELKKIKQGFDLIKNERLKKYEIKISEIDVDIYVYHYSNPGLPAEEVEKYSLWLEGFRIPRAEILLVLKLAAWQNRQGTPKGEKDKIDIIGLLSLPQFDFHLYKSVLAQYGQPHFLERLVRLILELREVKELGLNQYKFSRLKKEVLRKLR